MRRTKNYWLGVLLFGIIISVPEGTLIRMASRSLDASVITMLRYTVAGLIGLPFVVIAYRKKQITAKHIGYMMLLAIPLSVDPLVTQYVIATTSASFFAVLSLLTPVVFVIISALVTKDQLRRDQIIGFLLAVLGGMVMVALPYGGEAVVSYGLAPFILMLIQAICVSLAAIYWRHENQRGTPMIAILGIFYFVWALVATIGVVVSGKVAQLGHITYGNVLTVIYLGLIASIVYNTIFTGFYRRVGTTTAATMKYFKESLTVIVPILVLGEVISWQIALGALLIALGSVVVHKKHPGQKSSIHNP